VLRRLTGADVPNTIWPSDNAEGVPTLLLDRQAGVVDLPFTRWGRGCRRSRMRGTFHFYTDDYRFSRLWGRPQDLVNSACVAAVEPNWSVHAQTPPVVALWQTYRKRWLARLWQESGVRILVDLHVAPEHAEINLLGVPRGWRSFATRGSAARLDLLDREHELALSVAGALSVLLVVYGGGKAVAQRCRERGWLHFGEEADEVRATSLRPVLRAV
jgi:hypothetical protein